MRCERVGRSAIYTTTGSCCFVSSNPTLILLFLVAWIRIGQFVFVTRLLVTSIKYLGDGCGTGGNSGFYGELLAQVNLQQAMRLLGANLVTSAEE